MSEVKQTQARRVTRVALRSTTEKGLEDWRETLKTAAPAFSPSFSDLVAWAIESLSPLSKKHIEAIRKRFFDEIEELEYLVAQLKKAKASGDEANSRELLIEFKGKKPKSPRPKKQSPLEPEQHVNTVT